MVSLLESTGFELRGSCVVSSLGLAVALGGGFWVLILGLGFCF
jgi:hypothetical protein